MNSWIIAAVIVGLLIVTGIAVLINTPLIQADKPEKISCESCGGSCNGDRNCGLATCGAATGKSSCGCRG